MKIIKTSCAVMLLSGFSGAAFAADPVAPVLTDRAETKSVHPVTAPVLIDANPYGKATEARRIIRVVKEPVDTLVARDASTSSDRHFVFKNGKQTKTKSYKPNVTKSATMPNKFKR